MRFKNNQILPLCGAIGAFGLMFSGCGPKEQAAAPSDTVIVNNATPDPAKVTIESKPPEVTVKDDKAADDKKSDKMTADAKSADKADSSLNAKMPDTPVRSENKMDSGDKTQKADKMQKSDVKPEKTAKKDASLPEPASASANAPKELVPIPQSATRLIVEDIKIGSGKRAEPGTNVSVEYTGKLTDGTVFDSNAGGEPFTLMLGAGQVIKGWDNGLVGMKVGGKRRLIIPPDMGYGDQPAPGGKIPAGSTLVFTVELKDVQ